jgi:MFS transporter, FHS family, L-fucose permease
MRKGLGPVIAVFFVTGFADAAGAMVGFVRQTFHLSEAAAGLLPVCGFLSFGLFSLPGGRLSLRRGSRATTLLGLLLALAGYLAAPAAPDYPWLLAALLLIGAGMTLVLVGAHTLLQEAGDPDAFPRTLTFAQFVKGVGSISGPFLLALLAGLGLAWTLVFPVFALGTGAVLLWLALTPLPVHRPGPVPAGAGTAGFLGLLRDPLVAACVAGVALYTGAEVGLSAWLATHLAATFGLPLGTTATRLGPTLFFASLCAGRLLGSRILRHVAPRTFLAACALAGLAGVLGLLAPLRAAVVASVLLCGLAFGNLWPMLYAAAMARRPDRAGELSGLLCTAIAGGALLPPLMGFVGDAAGIRWSFLIPAGSFLYLSALALVLVRRPLPPLRG